QLLVLTGDNASNNDTMTNSLEWSLPGWGGQKCHVRCLAHVVNLIEQVSAGLSLTQGETDLIWSGCLESIPGQGC
ncbi:hypothetical protein K439DRAFT_1329446, partial [Ramaria rubella]